jgi:hypothetical protein
MSLARALGMLAVSFVPAMAAPPAPGSEDAAIMGPFIEWVETQHTGTGSWCCNVSDGRPVEARMSNGGWEIYVTSEKFPGTKPGWMRVPVHALLSGYNPVGVPIAWVMRGQIFCFAPSNGG